MSAAVDHDANTPSPAWEQGDEEVAGMSNGRQQITHEQIIGELGELRGIVATARNGDAEWRSSMERRVGAIEASVSQIAGDQRAMRATVETLKPAGAAAAAASVIQSVTGLLERSPLAVLVGGAVLIVWGAGGVAQVWHAFGN